MSSQAAHRSEKSIAATLKRLRAEAKLTSPVDLAGVFQSVRAHLGFHEDLTRKSLRTCLDAAGVTSFDAETIVRVHFKPTHANAEKFAEKLSKHARVQTKQGQNRAMRRYALAAKLLDIHGGDAVKAFAEFRKVKTSRLVEDIWRVVLERKLHEVAVKSIIVANGRKRRTQSEDDKWGMQSMRVYMDVADVDLALRIS